VKTVKNAREFCIPILVVDGGSPEGFLEEIRDHGATVLSEVDHPRGAMGPGRRQAIAGGFRITDGRISCYIEPEKYDMVRYVEMCYAPILGDSADLNVPRRYSWITYPKAQQLAEPLGNLHFRQVTGLDYDMWFGPRFFNAAAGKFFLEYNDEHGGAWDPTCVPVIRAAAAGLRVAATKVDYVNSPEQTAEEEQSASWTKRRAAQLANLMEAHEKEARILGLPR